MGAVEAPAGATVVDVSGCLLLPGLIDNHTHLSMPFMGMQTADDYDTGTQAAAAGGVTCLVDFAIQNEPDDLASALEEWQGRAAGAAHVDYGFHMAITSATDAALDDMGAMVEAGVASFKLFMAYKGALMVRDDELAAAMERARDLGALTWCTPRTATSSTCSSRARSREGNTSAIHHALTRPEMVEAEATGRAARLAEYTGASLFVVHVTCAAAAAEIEAAQQRGAQVTGETCTQYLVNTIDDLRRPGVEGCRYICSPPLRDASNHEPLWDYVRRGVLESVSTDHARSTTSRSRAGWTTSASCPTACRSSSTAWPSSGTRASSPGRITPSQLVDRTSTTVARRFGLDAKGAIAPGKDADIAVFDPAAPRAYGVANSLMNVDYDLYEGETASGSVRHTYCPRHARLRPGRDPHRARPRALRAARGHAGGGAGMTIEIDVDAVLADLDELAGASGGRSTAPSAWPGHGTGATRASGCAASSPSCR